MERVAITTVISVMCVLTPMHTIAKMETLLGSHVGKMSREPTMYS